LQTRPHISAINAHLTSAVITASSLVLSRVCLSLPFHSRVSEYYEDMGRYFVYTASNVGAGGHAKGRHQRPRRLQHPQAK